MSSLPRLQCLPILLLFAVAGCLGSEQVLSRKRDEPLAAACPPSGGANQFEPCAISYLGGAEDDELTTLAFGKDGRLWVGGTLPTEPDGLALRVLLDGGAGSLLELTADGRRLLGGVRLGAAVRALEVASNGNLVAAGSFGTVMLDARASQVLWHRTEAAQRLSIGTVDEIAVLLEGGGVRLYDAQGEALGAFQVEDPVVNDLAVHSTHAAVFVVGGHPEAAGRCQGSVPFLRSYSFSGTVNWRAYDMEDADGRCASSVGRRVRVAPDGTLLYVGEQAGGNSVHQQDPADVTLPAALVSYDAYNTGFGQATQTYSFVARFDAATGQLLRGQSLLPRDGMLGGELRTNALATGDDGNVYLAGRSTCCLERRGSVNVQGTPLSDYDAPELSVLVLAEDFSERRLWVTFTAAAGAESWASALAVQGGLVATAGAQNGSLGRLFTVEPLQAEPGGKADGFFAVWSQLASAP